MASKGEASNVRYESKTRNRIHETAENTKHRVGKTGSSVSRSKSVASSRSGRSGGATQQRGDWKAQSKKSGSIVKPPVNCASTNAAKERSSPKIKNYKHCEDEPYRHLPQKCVRPRERWQNGKYCRDECGSGVVANQFGFKASQRMWCETPLSMYQATIGELGRQILCQEKVIQRDVKPAPPCNVCEYILPPCRGYYRKYDCLRPCEEAYVSYKKGKKLYRDRVERYWEPCINQDDKVTVDINSFAHQNVFLGNKLKRKLNETVPCW